MLPNFLQCIGQSPQQRSIQPQTSVVPRLKSRSLDIISSSNSTKACPHEVPVSVEDITRDLGGTGCGRRGLHCWDANDFHLNIRLSSS